MAKREILFRGWNKKNKRWLYGYYFTYRGNHFISPDDKVNPLDTYEDYVIDADTVGQYTGMKDTNGVKIFEGDIIESNGSRHVMQYNERKAMFVTALVGALYITCGINQEWINEWKKVIVGNVYENKELIETK
nr:MAG TPA: YopX protein [Crassvirales sp.]